MSDDEPTPLGGSAPVPPPGTTADRFEVADGDLVRCGLAPYFFRVRRDGGGAMRLEPVGAAAAAALAAAAAGGALADEHQAQAEAAHQPGEPDDGDQGSGHGSLPALPRARVFPGREIAPPGPGCKGLGGAGEAGGGKRCESGGGAAYRTVPRPQ